MDLAQDEADTLIQLEKKASGEQEFTLPDFGGTVNIPLVSHDERENFSLDVARGRVELTRGKNQLRGRNVIVLVRLDYGGSPHRNPDDEEVPCPHIHLYREGYGDKWASTLPKGVFSNLINHIVTICEFMDYCRVTVRPKLQEGLFSK